MGVNWSKYKNLALKKRRLEKMENGKWKMENEELRVVYLILFSDDMKL